MSLKLVPNLPRYGMYFKFCSVIWGLKKNQDDKEQTFLSFKNTSYFWKAQTVGHLPLALFKEFTVGKQCSNGVPGTWWQGGGEKQRNGLSFLSLFGYWQAHVDDLFPSMYSSSYRTIYLVFWYSFKL